ncbi:MAG: TspO/MBR family protein [Chryseolinea sp.]
MTNRQIIRLIISLTIPLAVAAVAGYFTTAAIAGWYSTLNRPSFNPPNWVFGPVWTTLYLIMGFSCYLIWRLPESRNRNKALTIYGVQLALNFLWSFIFFYFKRMGVALIDISFLWFAVLAMIVAFRKLTPAAGYMNIPYLAWVSFATILNASYYYLNR